MPFENLRELTGTVKKYEVQAWEAERKASGSMALCFAIVFFTYALLFLPIGKQYGIASSYVAYDSFCMVGIGLISLIYGLLMNYRLSPAHLNRMPWLGLGYHSFLFVSIFYLWSLGDNISITPLFIILICLGFTWLHIRQYLVYTTCLLTVILISLSLVEFDYFWFLEFVVVYLFAVTLHIFHVSQQCRIFNYQQVIEADRNMDSLTGLLNRRALEEAILKPQAGCSRMAAILVDLDHFKSINDTFGHAAGDQALTYAADIFKRVFRKDDLVSRLGGDEFLIILQLDEDAQSVLRRKIDLLLHQVPLAFSGPRGDGSISFSVGAFLCSKTEDLNVDHMIAKADAAMYEVKRQGRNSALISLEDGGEITLKGLESPVKHIFLP